MVTVTHSSCRSLILALPLLILIGCASFPTQKNLNQVKQGMSQLQVEQLVGPSLSVFNCFQHEIHRHGYYAYGKEWGLTNSLYSIFKDNRLVGLYNPEQSNVWYWSTFYNFPFKGMTQNEVAQLIGSTGRSEIIHGYEIHEYMASSFASAAFPYYGVFDNGKLIGLYNQNDFGNWYWDTFWKIFQNPDTPEPTREAMRLQYEQYQANLRAGEANRQIKLQTIAQFYAMQGISNQLKKANCIRSGQSVCI